MINHNAVPALLKLLIHLDGAYAPNTLRAYRADMLEFAQQNNCLLMEKMTELLKQQGITLGK